MEAPELLVIPATPTTSPHRSRNTNSASTSFSSDSHSTPSTVATFRSSSEDTAVTIISMYSDGHEVSSSKIVVLNEGDSTGEDSFHSSISTNSIRKSSLPTTMTSSFARPLSINGDGRPVSRPPSSFQNGHAVAPEINEHRYSVAASSHRASEDSTFLPYTRQSFPPAPEVPQIPPQPPPKVLPSSPSRKSLTERPQSHRYSPALIPEPPQQPTPKTSSSSISGHQPSRRSSRTSLGDRQPSHHASRSSLTDRQLPPVPSIPPTALLAPIAGPSSLSLHTQRSEGEDADSFHVRATYAQLDAQGVQGDGVEEGTELTRAKQNGTDYLLSQPYERGPPELTSKERAVLASVDRYGFFLPQSATADRSLLLPTSTLQKPLSRVSPSSPSNTPAKPPALTTVPQPPTHTPKETTRIAKWGRMLECKSKDGSGNVMNWRVVPRKERKLRERIYKGIPDAWRAPAWGLLVERYAGVSRERWAELGAQYRESLEKPSTFDIQIDLDVPRTISGHVMFRTRYGHGQRSLFHVLHAFSLLCGDCGYVQGMGPIAATLLCYFEPEKVYGILVNLHGAYGMHEVFSPGFPGLLQSIYVMEKVVQRMMPDVYAVFKQHMISSTSYTTRWYITLFANCVPFQTQLRLWDAFFYEGRDMLVIIAVAILWVFRSNLTSSSANFETILSLLSSYFVPESEDAFLKWIERALGDKQLRSDMRLWNEEWKTLVREGKERDVLL